MKFFFFIFIFTQLLSLLDVFAEKEKNNLSEKNLINWEKIQEKKTKNLKKVIWKSYDNDESYFQKRIVGSTEGTEKILLKGEDKDKSKRKFVNSIFQIEPYLPLNNFLDNGDFHTSVTWKSSFDGGKASGTGQQNPSFIFNYGINDTSLISIYFSEADDDLYNLIGGQKVNYHWQNVAFSYKKKLLDENEFDFGLSLVSTLEYWKQSSGSETAKSIYNQKDNLFGKDKFEDLVGALSFPISKKLNENFTALIVPGITFLPEKLGLKGIGKNAYGSNFYIGSGLVFDVSEDLDFLFSFTTPLGPGSNYFDKDLNYSRKSIYGFGLGWEINPKIRVEGKITNSYGSSPSTGLLTIPSDNLLLYSANITYRPFEEDTYLTPLNERDKLISNSGITVSNALIPRSGTSQISANYDDNGNFFGFYGYSLSNIFQVELINIGSFYGFNSNGDKNAYLYSTFLDENNFNFRLGGKLLIFSPQKNDLYWLSLRSSVGRNNDTNQGYIFTELINTLRVNNWLTFNLSPKYFFSGVESFGGIGFSSYINLSHNLMLIPEINTSNKSNSNLNSTLALRYSFSPEKSLDLYYSNAAGVQDIGQLLKDEEHRLGIKINFLL